MRDACTSPTGSPGGFDVFDPGAVERPEHVILRVVRLPRRPGQTSHEHLVERHRDRNAPRALGLRLRPRQEQLVLLPVDLRPLEAQQLLLPAPRLQVATTTSWRCGRQAARRRAASSPTNRRSRACSGRIRRVGSLQAAGAPGPARPWTLCSRTKSSRICRRRDEDGSFGVSWSGCLRPPR